MTKKLSSCLMLIVFFVTLRGDAFSSFEEEARQNSVRQQGTCFQAACKVGGGLLLFFSGKAALEEAWVQESALMNRTGQLGCVTGLGMAVNGVEDFLDLLYTYFRPKSKLRLKQEKGGYFVPLTKKDREEEAREKFLRDIGMVKSVFNAGLVAFLSSVYFEGVHDNFSQGMGPFDLNYPEGTICSSYQMLCMPLTATMMLGASGVQLIYNFREFKQLWNDPKRNRGDVPLFGVLNGVAEVALSKMIRRYFRYTLIEEHYDSSYVLSGLKIFEGHLDRLPSISVYLLNVHGHYQVGASLVQMGRNAYASILTYFQRSKGPQFRVEEDDFLREFPERVSAPLPSSRAQTFGEISSEREEKYHPPSTQQKTKRRGVPGVVQDERPDGHEEVARLPLESVEDLNRNAERQSGLDRVNVLRLQYPLKVEIVRKELNRLVSFLPQGRLEGSTANVFKIIWQPHSKPVSLKFEFPHGKDATVFMGNKLDWVLNVIELAYLHGWDETRLMTYIEDNNRYNLLRLPQAIMFILGNRAS